MAPSSRDRLSVDLRGLKAALFDQAKATGVSPSCLVRTLLVQGLKPVDGAHVALVPSHRPAGDDKVRISIRLTATEAKALTQAAHAAELPVGAFLVRLLGGISPVPVLGAGSARAALAASCAELSSLTRALRHLTDLLRHGDIQAAVKYRTALDSAANDIRTHLRLASQVLEDLRPDLRRAQAAHRRPVQPDGN